MSQPKLTRRGYTAAFTVGNTPEADLMAKSPKGEGFRIDVKGLSKKNFWRMRERPPVNDLYYVLVHMPDDHRPPEYFVTSSSVAMREVRKLMGTPVAGGKPRKRTGSGLKWAVAYHYK